METKKRKIGALVTKITVGVAAVSVAVGGAVYYFSDESNENTSKHETAALQNVSEENFESTYNGDLVLETQPEESETQASISQNTEITLNELELSQSSNLLTETLDFDKAWAVYESINGERYVTRYVFTDDGNVYCAAGIDRSEMFSYWVGTYSVSGDEIRFVLEDNISEIDYTYRFDPVKYQFVQISDNGIFYSHVKGETLQLQEYNWNTAEEMIETIIFYGGFEK